MNDNVRKFCRNYYNITHCEFLEDDLFSKKLVEFYKNLVSKTNDDEKSLQRLAKIDKIINRYINDYNFSKKLKNSVDVSSIVKSNIDLTDLVLDYTVEFSEKYNDDLNSPIVNTRWI